MAVEDEIKESEERTIKPKRGKRRSELCGVEEWLIGKRLRKIPEKYVDYVPGEKRLKWVKRDE